MAIQLQRGNALAALNLTPLIDVLFLLLIFYLAAARLSQEDRELEVPLPTAANALPMTSEPVELVVNVNQAGQTIVEGVPVSMNGLEEVIRRTVTDNPNNHNITIRADRRVELQKAVTVMDVCLKCKADYSLSIAEEEAQ